MPATPCTSCGRSNLIPRAYPSRVYSYAHASGDSGNNLYVVGERLASQSLTLSTTTRLGQRHTELYRIGSCLQTKSHKKGPSKRLL